MPTQIASSVMRLEHSHGSFSLSLFFFFFLKEKNPWCLQHLTLLTLLFFFFYESIKITDRTKRVLVYAFNNYWPNIIHSHSTSQYHFKVNSCVGWDSNLRKIEGKAPSRISLTTMTLLVVEQEI